MPAWLASEFICAITAAPRPFISPLNGPSGPDPATYLATVIIRGSAQVTAITDGRKRALSALAYHVGGLLAWSGQSRKQIASQLIDASIAAGLRTA